MSSNNKRPRTDVSLPRFTATHIAYLHLCHRKLWLFSHGLNMEHTSELVAQGKLIEESSYPQRAQRWQQLTIEKVKIDHYDAKNGIVREVKKSNRRESAHMTQLKYYLFVLERNQVPVQYGLLEYPKMRITEEVYLSDEDRQQIPLWERQVEDIIKQEHCPSLLTNKSLCKRCAYQEFCYVGE